jgi:hypothetical protein
MTGTRRWGLEKSASRRIPSFVITPAIINQWALPENK